MAQSPKQIALEIGNKIFLVTPFTDLEVATAIVRIQKEINKTFDPRKQRRIRHRASITASGIILNV